MKSNAMDWSTCFHKIRNLNDSEYPAVKGHWKTPGRDHVFNPWQNNALPALT
jgi:hypothetical protein